jgi:diguanylate cyclase (GGDEF)-like protein
MEAKNKKIYILGDSSGVMTEVANQLAFFGYAPETLQAVSDLPQGVGDEPQILIVDAPFLEDAEGIRTLKAIKETRGGFLRCFYASNGDDFGERLAAVRAGADAFFSPPIEVTRMVEKIDVLVSARIQKPYHILIVDDDPEQVAYYAFILQQAGMITSVALDPKQVIKVLIEAKPELILMDMYMPDCSGPELAAIIRQQEAFVSIPIVYLSVETNRDKQVAAISLGADDFLTKPIKPEHLITSVSIRAERTRSMRYFMERDSLTGLLNHTHLKERLMNEVMRAHRIEGSLCFAMIDLDKFKAVNDTYGHLVGDRVLKSLSRLLQERLRKTDIIGRYGGEEFGVILINTGIKDAMDIMNGIREDFSRIKHVCDAGCFIQTFSCGIAAYPKISDPVRLNEAADSALYRAKDGGRNLVVAD